MGRGLRRRVPTGAPRLRLARQHPALEVTRADAGPLPVRTVWLLGDGAVIRDGTLLSGSPAVFLPRGDACSCGQAGCAHPAALLEVLAATSRDRATSTFWPRALGAGRVLFATPGSSSGYEVAPEADGTAVYWQRAGARASRRLCVVDPLTGRGTCGAWPCLHSWLVRLAGELLPPA